MVYYHGDSNVSALLAREVLLAEQVGSAEGFNIIAQTDFNNNSGAPWYEGHFQYVPESAIAATKRYRLTHTPGSTVLSSTPVDELVELNHDDPAVLQAFVEWSIENYPADRYGLIMVDHGGAWYGGFGGDYQDGDYQVTDGILPQPTAEAIRRALDNSGVARLAFFQFATCLMGNIESMDHFIGVADLYIGAAEITFQYPANIPGSLEWLRDNPSATMDAFGTETAIRFRQNRDPDTSPFEIIGTYDLNELQDVIDAWATFSGLAAANYQPSWTGLRVNTSQYEAEDYQRALQPSLLADMGEFIAQVEADPNTPENVGSAASILVNELQDFIVSVSRGSLHPNASGLSFFYPVGGLDGSILSSDYTELPITAQSNWDDYLQTVAEETTSSLPPVISVSRTGETFETAIFDPLDLNVQKDARGGSIYSLIGNVLVDIEEAGELTTLNVGTAFASLLPSESVIGAGWSSRLPMIKLRDGSQTSFIGAKSQAKDVSLLSSAFYVSDSTEPLELTDDGSVLEAFYRVDPETNTFTIIGAQVISLPSGRSNTIDTRQLAGARLTPLLPIDNIDPQQATSISDRYVLSIVDFIMPDNGLDGFEVVFGPVPDDFYEIEIDVFNYFFRAGESVRLMVQVVNGSYFGGWFEPEDTPVGWVYQNDYGWMFVSLFPWVYVNEKGWFYASGDSEGGTNQWLFSVENGWLWTSLEAFPFFYSVDTASWTVFDQLQ